MSLITVFIASIIGSPHCAGMCGGFVACISDKSQSAFLSNSTYHVGRLITYSMLGAAAGFLGQSIDNFGAILGFQRTVSIIMGAVLVYWGMRILIGGSSDFLSGSATSKLFAKSLSLFRIALQEKEDANWAARSFAIGAFSAFLPCGWLYMFTAVAAASGAPLNGALIMAVFWLGTVPVLVTVGGITRVLSSRLRVYIPRVTGVLLIVAGLYALSGRYQVLFAEPGTAPSCHHDTPAAL